MRRFLLSLALVAAAIVPTAWVASAAPLLQLDLNNVIPQPNKPILPQNWVEAAFTLPPDSASITAPGAFTVSELVGVTELPPLPVTSLKQDLSHPERWYLYLPSDLASNATYRVRVTGITAGPLATLTDHWDFSTSPDGRPPKSLTSFQATLGGNAASLSWSGPIDFDRAAVRVLRRDGQGIPAIGDPATTIVGTYPSPQSTATDAGLLPGHTYTYAAVPIDRDKPESVGAPFVAPAVSVPAPPPAPDSPGPTPSPTVTTAVTTPVPRLVLSRLLEPLKPGRLLAGRTVRVRWMADPGAAYYNLQLFRGTHKLVTTFPTRSRGLLKAKLWKPGKYRLVVWSGLGSKLQARYRPRPWLDVNLRVWRR